MLTSGQICRVQHVIYVCIVFPGVDSVCLTVCVIITFEL